MNTSHRGFVLVTAMIFLLVLTLVAVLAVKGSGLELRMSANNALHAEAFEAAEAPRQITSRLIERLGFNAETGWPVSRGGLTPDDQFAYTIPSSITLYTNDSRGTTGQPLNWFIDLSESSFKYESFVPRARFNASVVNGPANTRRITADIDVKRARTTPKTGCDLSVGGYEGISSRLCADYIFLVTSRGTDPTGQADYETSSMYRYVPR